MPSALAASSIVRRDRPNTRGRRPTASPIAGASRSGPSRRAAVVGLEKAPDDCRSRRRQQREQQPRQVIDMDERGAARRRHRHHAPLGGAEQVEDLAVARAIDRRRADDRPVEPAGLHHLLRARAWTGHRPTAPARAQRARRRTRSAEHPPRAAASTSASRAADIAEFEARRIGRVDHPGDMQHRLCALDQPAPAPRDRRGRRGPSRRPAQAPAGAAPAPATAMPGCTRASSNAWPTKPVPPVTAIVTAGPAGRGG